MEAIGRGWPRRRRGRRQVTVFDMLGFGERGWGAALIAGMFMTLAVSLTGLMIGSVLGSLIAWAKLSGHKVGAAIGDAYASVFRGLPELLVIYFVYFGSSALLTGVGNLIGIEGFVGVPAFAAGALGVGIISGAYQAEV